MRTKDAIRFALTISDGAVMRVIDKMGDAATTIPDAERRMPSAVGAWSFDDGRGNGSRGALWRKESCG